MRFPRHRSRSIPAVALTLAVAIPCAVAEPSPPAQPPQEIRGITVSTHIDGRDWAWDSIVPTFEEIKSLGANWVTIHPYAAIRADGEVRFRPIDAEHPPQHVVRPIREAHAVGLKILIKPHLAYWGSPFKWRGAIEFSQPAQWRRFWSDYERWIVALAEVSAEADGFVVGTELDRTLQHEEQWRRIITRVREHTPALLTYAANWNEFQAVPFWDALDAIGIQAYFPLADEEDTSAGAIGRGWSRWMARLRGYSEEQQRPIVFTELGYSRSHRAPVRPWDPAVDGTEALSTQETCMRAALQAVRREPRVLGAFLWKWFPQPRPVGHNFRLATPRMKQLIREAWD